MKDLTLVRSNERLDDLERNGYKIIQNPEVFCFGIDAVLLSHFAKVKAKEHKVLDIGTGTGIIPILMYAIYQKGHYTAIDIQEEMVDLASRSVKLNEIEDNIQVLCHDIKDYMNTFKPNTFDLITCNPPYMKGSCGLTNKHPSKMIARHEIACTLEDIIKASGYLLKERGKLCMVHRPHRLVDIFYLMRTYAIEPKRMQLVYPKADKEPTMVLIEGVKKGNAELRVEKPLIIYNEDGSYTEDIYLIYGKKGL